MTTNTDTNTDTTADTTTDTITNNTNNNSKKRKRPAGFDDAQLLQFTNVEGNLNKARKYEDNKARKFNNLDDDEEAFSNNLDEEEEEEAFDENSFEKTQINNVNQLNQDLVDGILCNYPKRTKDDFDFLIRPDAKIFSDFSKILKSVLSDVIFSLIRHKNENSFSGLTTSGHDKCITSYLSGQVKCQYLTVPEQEDKQSPTEGKVREINLDIKKVVPCFKKISSDTCLYIFSFKRDHNVGFYLFNPDQPNSSRTFTIRMKDIPDNHESKNLNLPDYSCGVQIEVSALKDILDYSKKDSYDTETVNFRLQMNERPEIGKEIYTRFTIKIENNEVGSAIQNFDYFIVKDDNVSLEENGLKYCVKQQDDLSKHHSRRFKSFKYDFDLGTFKTTIIADFISFMENNQLITLRFRLPELDGEESSRRYPIVIHYELTETQSSISLATAPIII